MIATRGITAGSVFAAIEMRLVVLEALDAVAVEDEGDEALKKAQ